MEKYKFLSEKLVKLTTCNIAHSQENAAFIDIKSDYSISDFVAYLELCSQLDDFVLKLSQIKWFMHICENEWILSSCKEILAFLNVLQKSCCVPSFIGREDCGYSQSDFRNTADKAVLAMLIIDDLLHKVSKCSMDNKPELQVIWQHLCINALIFYGENCQNCLWSTDDSHRSAELLHTTLVQLNNCNLTELLLKPAANDLQNKKIFHIILKELQPKLTKSNWKSYPAATIIIQTFIKLINFPHLSEFLSDILPPALLLVDDFQLDHRLRGISYLKHILENVSSTEILWYGRADVIFSALNQLTYTHDAELIVTLHPCLRHILQFISKDPLRVDDPSEDSKVDVVFAQLLRDMEFETKLVVRRAFASQLQAYVSLLGIEILKHIKRIFNVVNVYMEIEDGEDEGSRLCIAKAIKDVIILVWPRIGSYCAQLMQCFVKCLYDLAQLPHLSDGKSQLVKCCIDSMILLKRCCSDLMTPTIAELIEVATYNCMNSNLICWLTLIKESQ